MPDLILPSSYRRQQHLLEYAAIKTRCPEGLYLSPTQADPAKWAGVYFVREGPYASAVIHIELWFPETYPEYGPDLALSTEIFHPLVVPLTTYTFASGALDPGTTFSSSEVERLSPGSFNLRHEFGLWYQAQRKGTSEQIFNSSAAPQDANHREIETPVSTEQTSATTTADRLLEVLRYVKDAFEDPTFLDELPLDAAVNTNAWHAWRAHRGLPKAGSRSTSPVSIESSRNPLSPGKNPSEWNWEGVWESRVRNGIEESINDITLFGSKNARIVKPSGPIRFTKLDDEKSEEIQQHMMRALGMKSG